MQRNKNKTLKSPSFIFTADWHLRETSPICRTDDFETAQWDKVAWIVELAKKQNCPILHAGDLFDYWKPSPSLLTKTIEALEGVSFYSIYGNHDLPQHSLERIDKCGLFTLKTAGVMHTELNGFYFAHWGQTPPINLSMPLVWHEMTYSGEPPWPGCTDLEGGLLLHKYKNTPLILTGHNHKTFVKSTEGRLLVNPGSITRQAADQINHKPSVFIWYRDDNTVEQVFLPVEQGVITRHHIDEVERRDKRIEAFISRLDGDFSSEISFEANVKRLIEKNKIDENVVKIVNEILYS